MENSHQNTHLYILTHIYNHHNFFAVKNDYFSYNAVIKSSINLFLGLCFLTYSRMWSFQTILILLFSFFLMTIKKECLKNVWKNYLVPKWRFNSYLNLKINFSKEISSLIIINLLLLFIILILLYLIYCYLSVHLFYLFWFFIITTAIIVNFSNNLL